MENGTLIFVEEDVRLLILPPDIEGLKALCRHGLNRGELSALLGAVENKWREEYEALKASSAYLFAIRFPEWPEGLTEEEEDNLEEEEDREWERRKVFFDRARDGWRAVAGEWVDIIEAAPYPYGRGKSLVIHQTPPTEGWDGEKWVDRKARRKWRAAARQRTREAEAAVKEGRPLPPWALMVPLTQYGRGVHSFLSHTETEALKEALGLITSWTCDGTAKQRLSDAVRRELAWR